MLIAELRLRLERLAFVSEVCKQWRIWVFSAQSFFPPCGSFEGNKKRHLQLHLPCFDGSQSKNDIKKAFRPIRSDKSLNFSYPWTDKDCYGWLGRGRSVCSLLGSASMSWRLQWWLKTHRCEFCISSQPELSSSKSRLLGAISLDWRSSDQKSVDLRLLL